MCAALVTLGAVANGWLYASAATSCGTDCSQLMPCSSPTSLAGVLGLWGTAADPLAGTLDASGAWLLQLGLRWAEPRVLVPGLNPMLALRDYCTGLGAEFCDTVTSALHLAARHRLGAPPPQVAQALAVPGSQLDTTQPFPPSVACTDLATG